MFDLSYIFAGDLEEEMLRKISVFVSDLNLFFFS